jgi:death-on-curing protein
VRRRPRWLSRAFLLAVHERLLAEHGGARGVRDAAALESVLAAPLNLAAYGDADLFDLAAAYANSMVRLHPFVDGNKRVALVAAGVFLERNGVRLTAGEADAVAAMLALVTNAMTASEFAARLRASCEPGPRPVRRGPAAKRPAAATRPTKPKARRKR